MKRRVVVTGMGTYNPLGNNVQDSWKKLVAAESGIGPITHFDAANLKTRIAGEVRNFDPVALLGRKEARRMDRVTQLALAAASQALDDSGLLAHPAKTEGAGVVLGCGMGNVTTAFEGARRFEQEDSRQRVNPFYVPMILADSASATISIKFGLRGASMAIATACAAGNNAIGEAARMIRHGDSDIMVTGGSEASLEPIIIAGFNSTGALSTANDDPSGASRPFDLNRDGFVASEGAAILILEELAHALDRGAHIYAELKGYGASSDAYHVSAPDKQGRGAFLAMSKALKDAGLRPAEIDYINTHGTGTKLNDRVETMAIKDLFGEHASALAVSSTKSIHGHLLGAAGALETIVSIMAIVDGIAPPTINYRQPDPECDLDCVPNVARPMPIDNVMSNGFGLGGHNAVIIVGRYEQDRPLLQ